MPITLLSPEYGLSNSKLEECTANPSDVRSGKTFYAGNKELKTGTAEKTYTTVLIGSQSTNGWNSAAVSVNIKSLYPDIYDKITRSNFYGVPIAWAGNSTGPSGNQGSSGDNISYSPSTGAFRGSSTYIGPGGTWAGNINYKFYLTY